jgi:hypothetical protein
MTAGWPLPEEEGFADLDERRQILQRARAALHRAHAETDRIDPEWGRRVQRMSALEMLDEAVRLGLPPFEQLAPGPAFDAYIAAGRPRLKIR